MAFRVRYVVTTVYGLLVASTWVRYVNNIANPTGATKCVQVGRHAVSAEYGHHGGLSRYRFHRFHFYVACDFIIRLHCNPHTHPLSHTRTHTHTHAITHASAAQSTIACHPVFPALAAALRPRIQMMPDALEARPPASMGAPALAASMAAFVRASLPAADLAAWCAAAPEGSSSRALLVSSHTFPN